MQSEQNEGEDVLVSRYGDLLGGLLFSRGIKTADEAERFLNPNYERDLHDPFLILNMDRAVERILRAIGADEKIIIYGDYDCDGIPGSVILHDFFKKIGYANFYVYIPHRHNEGYGLNIVAVEKFAADDVKLLITVDNGITDVAEVARAGELGVDVIITDHHLPALSRVEGPEVLPAAYAILNSKQSADKYPFDMLCGAGVAFKLVQALLLRGKFNVPKGWHKWLLDMAGLSTIADMVPLQGENRALAYFGLKVLRVSPRPGIMKLLYKARVDQRMLTEEDVGFTIAPRINAASRMGEPIHGFNLLAEVDETRAGVCAEYLELKNNERKRAVDKMMREVEKMMGGDSGLSVIVVGHREFAPGVVGLAASRIVERYKRPAFVWGASGGGEIKGSCRSDGRVNLVELMTAAGGEKLFTAMGGHALAGGFSVDEKSLEGLAAKLSQAYAHLGTKLPSEEENIIGADKKIFLDDVTLANYELISKMAPFGVGNRRPIFLLEELEIFSINFFGSPRSGFGQTVGDHLRLNFKNSFGEIISAVLFKYKDKLFNKDSLPLGSLSFDLLPGDRVSLLAHIEKDSFSHPPCARLRILDLR